MTQKRDLKRRVRERQIRTGESYMTALRHVRGEPADVAAAESPGGAPPGDAPGGGGPSGGEPGGHEPGGGEPGGGEPPGGAIPVVELVDISATAEALGLTCRAMVMPAVLERVDATALLTQLRGVLRTTASDPAFAVLRGVALLGERPSFESAAPRGRPHSAVVPDDALQFAARVRAGVGGISNNGRSLAFAVTGGASAELVVFSLWPVPPRYNPRPPALLITTPGQLSINLRFGLEALPWTEP